MEINLFFYSFIFILGLMAGSFLNCVIYRLEKNQGFVAGRSYCPHCRHQLHWKDLIPVLSFFILRGKCRYCHQKISWQYPLAELITGFLFLLAATYNLQFTIFGLVKTCYLFVIIGFLVIIFVYDLKHYVIPDKVIYPAIIVSGMWYFVSGIFFKFYARYEIPNIIYSALGAAAFFFLIVLVSRGKWMGIGDIKLAFFMGIFLGFPGILIALFLAFLLGGIMGLGLVILRKKTFKSEVPFGPFLTAATLISLFWGEKIVSFYLNLMKI
jgi:leader peptidase (prepilin peptidase)/N-methyltransferase